MKIIKNVLYKFVSILEGILKVLTFILFVALLATVFTQVFARFLLPKAPPWTEELSRFIFVWLVGLAAPLALKNNGFVFVDVLTNKLNDKTKRILFIIINIMLLVLFILFTFESFKFMKIGFYQTAPSMPKVKMYIPFLSMTVSGFCLIIFNIYNFTTLIKNGDNN